MNKNYYSLIFFVRKIQSAENAKTRYDENVCVARVIKNF